MRHRALGAGLLSIVCCAWACGEGTAVRPPQQVPAEVCQPTSCQAEARNCGSIPDGCGHVLDCGTCAPGESCGAGGVENVCGTLPPRCVPTTCEALGASCGSPADGCGGVLECGACPGPEEACDGPGAPDACADVRAFRRATRWVQHLGGPARDFGRSLVTTPSGELLMASLQEDTAGPQAPASWSAVLSGYSGAGERLGERRYADSGFPSLLQLAAFEGRGFQLAASGIQGDLGGGPATVGSRNVVARYSSEGRWEGELAITNASIAAIATSREGLVAVLSNPGPMAPGTPRLELYAPDGSLRWTRVLENGKGLEGVLLLNRLAFHPDGGLVVAGSAHASFTMDGQHFEFSQLGTPLLLALDTSDGRLLWARGLEGGQGSLTSLAITAAGDLRATGHLRGSSDGAWGPSRLRTPDGVSSESIRPILLAADSRGRPTWGQVLELPLGFPLLAAEGEDVVFAHSLPLGDCGRAVVRRYSATGELLWSRAPLPLTCPPGSTTYVTLDDLAVLPNRDIALLGSFRERVDLGTGVLSASGFDTFLLTMAPSAPGEGALP